MLNVEVLLCLKLLSDCGRMNEKPFKDEIKSWSMMISNMIKHSGFVETGCDNAALFFWINCAESSFMATFYV